VGSARTQEAQGTALSADAEALAPPALRGRTLGRWSLRILTAMAEVVTPRVAGAPTVETAEVVAFIDGWVPHMPRLFRLLFPVGLLMFELGALVLGPSLVPFSFMRRAQKERYVRAWVDARWALQRDVIKAVKGLCLLCYYSDERVAAHIGYTVREHVELVGAERLRRHGHEL
jgi:hypothetical protein